MNRKYVGAMTPSSNDNDLFWFFSGNSSLCLGTTFYISTASYHMPTPLESPLPATASKAGFSALVCTPFLRLAFIAARVCNALVLVAWEMARFPKDGELEGGEFMLATPQAHGRLCECRGHQDSTEMPGSSWQLESKYAVSEESLDARMNVKLCVILFAYIHLQFYFNLRI